MVYNVFIINGDLVRALRELHGSTSEMDSIANLAVVFYDGGQ